MSEDPERLREHLLPILQHIVEAGSTPSRPVGTEVP
jgi:hypothetical protein